jgi:hypothetical protein
LVRSYDLVVAMDYGQFVLRGGESSYEADPDLALHERARNGMGIAAHEHTLVVLSPHQNNFAMPLQVHVFNEEPAHDDDQWDEVFEATLEIDDGNQLLYDSPTVTATSYAVPAGRYGVRVCGRGFVGYGWPGSTRPGDSWRVQLWPDDRERPARRLRAWAGPNR